MEIKKEKSLESTANRIGFVFLLGYLLMNPCDMFVEKFLNFSIINETFAARYLAISILSVFLLKINVKKIFKGKHKNKDFGFKQFLFLTLFFIMLNRCVTTFCCYVTGYYKLLYATEVGVGREYSNNIALISIRIFIVVVLEEFVYRGIILENLRKYGEIFAIVASGIVFGVGHGIVIFCKSFTGILLGIIYVVSGNIKWSIIFHYICNMGSGLSIEILSKYFPQLTNFQIDLIIMVITFILMLIFLFICLKDKVLNAQFHRWSIKNILNKLKEDRYNYKKFFSTLGIAIYLIIQFSITLWGVVEQLKVLLNN